MKKIILLLSLVVLISAVIIFIPKENKKEIIDIKELSIGELQNYAKKVSKDLIKEYKYDKEILENEIIDVIEEKNIIVYISKGKIDYAKLGIDESGRIPVMMYHGIYMEKNNDNYIGGNVDRDGYNRTIDAFKNDLEKYYKLGYRIISLNDYINGDIDVELGYSPIVLTFDDGLENNIRVIGLDQDSNIIIDPNSAVGILEEYKRKYPDFNVSATFFINGSLFNQEKYNDLILKWLVENNYDIGNHTYSHVDFTKISVEDTQKEIGKMYDILDEKIKERYTNIVALPFGSPYNTNHKNFSSILLGKYNGKEYTTTSTLRVGWEADYSPYTVEFDKRFIKRIRAYDNNGKDFDIEMNFNLLEKNRFISDGNKSTITIPKSKKEYIANKYNKEIITY